MPAQVTNHKCPACTGPLHFAGGSGKLECEYCGSIYDVAEIEALYAEKEEKAKDAFTAAEEKAAREKDEQTKWEGPDAGSSWGEEGENLKVYNCPSCGAELICDQTTAATSCPYCGNPAIVPGQFDGALKPDYVIPFKIEKEAAVQALKNHYKGKPLLPKTFSSENHIQKIQGVYVPFWLFDGEADASVEFHATRTHVHVTGNEEITTTEHYKVYRSGTVSLERIPVDASSKMPDNHMDSIEPFDYQDLKPFSTAYLPGFLADKYDVSIGESAKRVEERATNTAVEAMRDSVLGYHTCTMVDQYSEMRQGQVKYALMPVWMLSTQWKGQNFLFAMNGQTGRLIGDLPISWGKFWAFFFGISVGLSILLIILFSLFF